MGTWSGEPFGNDTAADWAWELEDADSWEIVRSALTAVVDGDDFDEEDATLAVAAAEVVAHGLGRPTQEDAYTEEVIAFAKRMVPPSADLVALAQRALVAATATSSPLAELWDGEQDWAQTNGLIAAALRDD